MRDDRFSIDIPKRWLRRAVIAVAVGMLVVPAVAIAGHNFDDVPNSNIFHEDIEWMADEGVTKGCNPPENTEYCPEENVKRQEMAAFLHRMDTQDVFVTPDEADSMTHFAAVAADGTLYADNGLESASNDAVGVYTLEFADDISECSWTGTVGGREGMMLTNYNVTLNAGADDNSIEAHVWDGNAGALADAPFDVTVNC